MKQQEVALEVLREFEKVTKKTISDMSDRGFEKLMQGILNLGLKKATELIVEIEKNPFASGKAVRFCESFSQGILLFNLATDSLGAALSDRQPAAKMMGISGGPDGQQQKTDD